MRIGPAAAAAIAAPGEPAATTAKCPFSGLLPAAEAATDALSWTPAALARLEAIPELVRPMARAGIEMVAKESGLRVIDETVLAAARSRFGM